MRYSDQPRDQVFVTGYGFLSFAKNMDKNIGKNISKNLNSKYSQKLLHHAKQSVIDAIKSFLKRLIQKAVDATGDLAGNEIANRVTKVSKSLLQNNSEIITNEHDKEIPKERYISPEERQKIIDDLRLI